MSVKNTPNLQPAKNESIQAQDHVDIKNTDATEKASLPDDGLIAYLYQLMFGNDTGKSGAPEYASLEPEVPQIPAIPTLHWTDKYENTEIAKLMQHNIDVIKQAKVDFLENDGHGFVDQPAVYPLGKVAPGFDTIGLKFAMLTQLENVMFRVESPSTVTAHPITPPPPTDDTPHLTGKLENILVEEDDLTLQNNLSAGNNEDGSVNAHEKSGDLKPLVDVGNDGPPIFSLDSSQSALDTLPILFSNGVQVDYKIVGDTLTGTAGQNLIFTFHLDSSGTYEFKLNDQIDHPFGDNKENTLPIDLGGIIHVTDQDLDAINLNPGTFIVTVVDDIPVTGPNPDVQLDDDTVSPYGLQGTESNGDTEDAVNVTGTLNFSIGADELPHGGENNPNNVTYLDTGAPAGFSYELSGSTLLIRQDGNPDPVLTLTLNTTTGDYSVVQNQVINHPEGTPAENNQDFVITYRVTDADGDSADGTLNIHVNDDSPHATDKTNNLDVHTTTDTNILLILDTSGSMGDQADHGAIIPAIDNLTRLDVLKEAAGKLLDKYDELGDVKVQIVTFSTDAHIPQAVWMDIADAKALIAGLTSNGATNYQDALLKAMDAYADAGKIGPAPNVQNVAYFLSDGNPTVNLNDQSSGGVTNAEDLIQPAQLSDWITFLDNNDINAFALGLGSGIGTGLTDPTDLLDANPQQELDKAAYNGVNNIDTTGQVITDLSELTVNLNSTVTSGSVIGDLFVPGDIGADQSGFVKSIVIDGTTFNFDGSNPITDGDGNGNATFSSFNAGTHELKVISTFGTLTVDMDNGSYTFAYDTNFSGPKNIGFTISDHDGDTSSATLQLTATGGAVIVPNNIRDDHVLASGTTFAIPVYALFQNDIDPQGIDAALIGGSVSANATIIYDAINHAFNFTFLNNDVGQIGYFTYGVNSNGVFDTAFVTVEQIGNSAIITGTGLDEIIIDQFNNAGPADVDNGLFGHDVLVVNENASAGVTLNGGEGNDLLVDKSLTVDPVIFNGGIGDDIIRIGVGTSTIHGDAGVDMIDFSNAVGATGIAFTIGMNGEGSFIPPVSTGLGTITSYDGIEGVIGTKNDDTLTGNGDDNIFRGGGGDDTIDGAGGNDIIDYRDATGGISINLVSSAAVTDFSAPGLGTDHYSNIEGVYGSQFNDDLGGNASNNVLSGFGGDDLLTPNGGNDTLTGGSGRDTFIFTTADSNSTHIISDFVAQEPATNPNGDKLDLSGLLSGLGVTDATPEANLANYLHFSSNGTNTTIDVKPDGVNATAHIQLNAIDLTNGNTNSDAQVIHNLMQHHNLHVG